MVRELVVLGTASQVPTRARNQNGYVLRWDGESVLLDPGEGTQRQLTLAGVSAASLTRICVTHAHGDHCLGLPGVLQRIQLDRPGRSVEVHSPEAAAPYVERLTGATTAFAPAQARLRPVAADGVLARSPTWTLSARALDHRVPAVGYRLEEEPGRRVLPDRLRALGIEGPDVGRLVRQGRLDTGGRTVRVEDVSEPRPGQVFAFVMDTRLCDAAYELARGADLLVCESTFLTRDARLAEEYRHLTAAQAAGVAREAGARRLVLTHFSQRYGDDGAPFEAEAREVFPEAVAVRDLDRVPVPGRR